MRHLKPVTTPMIATAVAKQDELGYIFLQLWLTVMSMILGKAFTE